MILGDSIIDGYQAVGPPGQRWTDVLAQRFDCYHPDAAGDSLLAQAIPPWLFGVPVPGHEAGMTPGTHPVVVG